MATKPKADLSDLLEVKTETLPALRPGFMWIQRRGDPVSPHIMATQHLCNCFKMMWNHFTEIPLDYQFRKYRFNTSVFTPEYVRTAVVCIGAEIATRDDLTERQSREIKTMMKFRTLNSIAQEIADNSCSTDPVDELWASEGRHHGSEGV